MGVQARVVLDSISGAGHRLTTMELTYWLMIHNEDLRHRTHWSTDDMKFDQWLDAGNSVASNRAIAPARIRDQVVNDPYIPQFVEPTRGMVGGAVLTDQSRAVDIWLSARDAAVAHFDVYETEVRVHKQHRNRLLAPWQYVTVVKTATAEWWASFFALRDHPGAQPDFQIVARPAHEAYLASTPRHVNDGFWHMPFVTTGESLIGGVNWRRVSVARCARTSFLRQGEHLAVEDDLRLYDDLARSVPPHESPKEHVATPVGKDERAGIYVGWASMRHFRP